MAAKPQKLKISRKCGFHNKTTTSVQTPTDLYKELDKEYNFDFDPCPLDPQPKSNGLQIAWKKSNFVNPPYDKVGPWIEKAIKEATDFGNKSVFLIPFRANTKYFTEMVFKWCTNLFVFSNRIIFEGYTAPLPLLMCVVVFDPEKMQLSKPTAVQVPACGLPTKAFGYYSTVILK